MSLRLLSSPASPFARMARASLIETGQEDVEIVDVTTTPLATDASVAAANPVGKIPALERPDGPAIFDSRVICRYLDDRAGAGLYPASRLWEVLTLEALAHGIAEAAVLCVYEKRFRAGEMQFQPWLDAQWGKVTRSLDALEARWMSHLSGPVTQAQVSTACALGYLDFRHPDKPWRPGREALADWFAAFSERPCIARTMPPPA